MAGSTISAVIELGRSCVKEATACEAVPPGLMPRCHTATATAWLPYLVVGSDGSRSTNDTAHHVCQKSHPVMSFGTGTHYVLNGKCTDTICRKFT